ncbi:hypothetical protein ACFO25_11335 [Paenactinomyces guangxiensis]|uniref:Immunity protein Imm1 n=1 Tax=Paenactinomyces guangxiensis TaxID=1490290 RepID=A0A7W2A8C4_9BACL|nr:hypothetical protein [Paenactinomyces guangxiensis]MBA4494012.1 hypothetical protein [Paenactinomyces guangxiensis]MBH8591243.1 hypothetical protein [Paenactinomyces guangxiensis]
MNLWQLRILTPGEIEVITSPSWDHIKLVLDQVDGFALDNVSLLSEEAGDLMVAGGDEYNGVKLYYVSYYLDGYSEDLVNPSVSKEDEKHITITVQEVGTDIPRRYLVEYRDMIKAFKYFFETGELTKDQEWE